MYLQIKKITKEPDKFGSHLKIIMIGLYENDGTWIKWVKLNDSLIAVLKQTRIEYGR